MKRSSYWREELSDEFANLKFRREYFLTLIHDEDLSVIEALRRVVRAMGIKEFGELIDMPASNVSRVLASNDFKLTTLEKFLAAFGLELSVEKLAS